MIFTLPNLMSLLVAAAGVSKASPLDVFSPKITFPTAGAVFPVGSFQKITWDTSDIPPSQVNATGLLLLGQQTAGSENLDTENPLATQFPIAAGSVNITVPVESPADNYIVVLFGDSGNTSPEFTITQ